MSFCCRGACRRLTMVAALAVLAASATSSALAQLSAEEQQIVALLRQPSAELALLEYRIRVTVSALEPDETYVFEARCRLPPAGAEVGIGPTIGGVVGGPHADLLGLNMIYRLAPGTAELDFGQDFTAEFTPGHEQVSGRHWGGDMPALGPALLSACDAVDLAAYAWTHARTEENGLEVYEARAKRAIRRDETPQVVGYRFWRDPNGGYVTRVVAFTAEDAVVSETTYDEVSQTPDGRSVPLRGTTTVVAGSWTCRVEPEEKEIRDVPASRPAMTIITDYEWFDDLGVRLPVFREVTDDQGRMLCRMVYFKHTGEPKQ